MSVHCYGIIPLRKNSNGEWEALVVQQRRGLHWSFPKGHAEGEEAPAQTASRELFEETGLTVARWLLSAPLTEKYTFLVANQKVQKSVSYFIAEVSGKLTLQANEIVASQWVPFAHASDYITFPEAQELAHEALLALERLQ